MRDTPTTYLTGRTDARYDRPRQWCACGSGYFLPLAACEVHAGPTDQAPVVLLTPYHDADDTARLPIAECVQCRTRYDAQWREVG